MKILENSYAFKEKTKDFFKLRELGLSPHRVISAGSFSQLIPNPQNSCIKAFHNGTLLLADRKNHVHRNVHSKCLFYRTRRGKKRTNTKISLVTCLIRHCSFFPVAHRIYHLVEKERKKSNFR